MSKQVVRGGDVAGLLERASSATAPRLPIVSAGRTWDLSVPAQRVPHNATFLDCAGPSGARTHVPAVLPFAFATAAAPVIKSLRGSLGAMRIALRHRVALAPTTRSVSARCKNLVRYQKAEIVVSR